MPDRDSHLDAIAAADTDTAPLLAYAGWLVAHGEPERAEFIRLQASPAADGSTLPRVKELYAAHGKRWFAPAYDLIRTAVTPATRSELAAAITDVSAAAMMMMTTGVPVRLPSIHPPAAAAGGILAVPIQETIHPWGVTLMPDVAEQFKLRGGDIRLTDVNRAFSAVSVHRGVVSQVSLGVAGLLRREAATDLLTREPVHHLDLELPPVPQLWQRFDGPHLRRVRHLKLTFRPEAAAADFGPTAAAVFASPHLAAVTDLTLEAGSVATEPTGISVRPNWVNAPTAGVIDRLLASPLLPRLKALTLSSGGGAGWLDAVAALADTPADVRLESFTLNSWEYMGKRAGPVPDVAAALARLPVRPRLKHLHLHGVPLGPEGVRRLLADPPWERLESLILGDAGVGDAGATAIAEATSLPALRSLGLSKNDIGDAGATALAAAPFARRLRSLDLSNNPFGDAGAEAAAALLDQPTMTLLNLYGFTFTAANMMPGRELGWLDRVTSWVLLPFTAVSWLMLKHGLAGKMFTKSGVSAGVRTRLKEKHGERLYFGP